MFCLWHLRSKNQTIKNLISSRLPKNMNTTSVVSIGYRKISQKRFSPSTSLFFGDSRFLFFLLFSALRVANTDRKWYRIAEATLFKMGSAHLDRSDFTNHIECLPFTAFDSRVFWQTVQDLSHIFPSPLATSARLAYDGPFCKAFARK